MIDALTAGDVLLGVALVIACITDLRSQKIYNALTFPLMLTGLGYGAVTGAFWASLLGLGAAFVLHFTLFAVGVDRAGDAKLMMGVGAFVGWLEMVEATVITLLVFAPAGVLVLLLYGRLGAFVDALRWTGRRLLTSDDPGPRPEGTPLPKAPFILVGVAVGRFTDLLAWLVS